MTEQRKIEQRDVMRWAMELGMDTLTTACRAGWLMKFAQKVVAAQPSLVGMPVSVDVSTGDHDAGNRLFGTVYAVQAGVLLVEDAKPNYAQPAPQRVAVPEGCAVFNVGKLKSIMYKNCPALRSESAHSESELDRVLATSAAPQPDGVGDVHQSAALRLLVASGNRIEGDSEEGETAEGMAVMIPLDSWHEFAEALDSARALIAKGDV